MENKKISSKILGSLLLLALACLMPMAMMAQQTHWTPVSAPYEDNMTLTGVIQINGVEQQSAALEVGAFCGTECRGSVRAVLFPPTGRYVVQLTIFGNNGDQITFRLYDHDLGVELDLQSPDAVTFGSSGIGSLVNPYVLVFTEVIATYTITVSANPSNGGTVSGGGTYQQGQSCHLIASANAGYTFTNWTENGTVVANGTNWWFQVTRNRTLVANFALQVTAPTVTTYNVTDITQTTATAGGNVTNDGGGTVTERGICWNTSHNPTTSDSHASNGTGTGTYTVNMTGLSANTTYYVRAYAINSVFTAYGDEVEFTTLPNIYTINVSASPTNGGTVSGGGSYVEGATCTLTATANTGYTFVNWTENGNVVSTNANYTFTVNSNRTLVAQFQLQCFSISASASPSDGGMVSGGGTYNYGSTCNLTATPAEGYTFVNWTENGNLVSTEASYSFTVTGNRSLVVNFEFHEEYIVFADPNVKAICVANWDTNGDGELSYDEAAAVTDLGTVFQNNANITSFNELQYFTGLSSIGGSAFSRCYHLTSVEIHTSVTSIGEFAFLFCKLTGSLVIPNTVTSLGTDAFYGCSSLTGDLVIPNSMTSIGFGAFIGCSGLTGTLTIPNSVTSIGAHAFQGCSGLTSVYYTGDVTQWCGISFGNEPFNYSHNLYINNQLVTDLVIPNSVTLIGNSAFCNCTGLTSLEIPNSVTSIGNSAFCNCTGLTSLEIPNSVTSIGNNAFYGCSGLTGLLTVPNSVTSIGDYAFADCTNLTSIISYATTPPTLGTGAFDNVPNTITVFVPCFSLESYWEANVWNQFTNYQGIDCPSYVYEISVTSNPTIGGTISGSGTYECGTLCTLMATSNEVYTFMYWTEDGAMVSSEAEYSFFVVRERNLVAHFSPPLTITAPANPTEGGVVEGVGEYDYNTTCTLIAMPNEGYTFMYWTENENQVSSNASYTFTVTSDRNLVAHFALPFSIIAAPNPVEGGSITGEGEYDYGSTCTLTATANEGYSFMGWTESDRLISANAEYSFTVTSDRNLVAIFTDESLLTVYDGTATIGHVPVYSTYCDYFLKCETVYPMIQTDVMTGGVIGGLRFYATKADVNWGDASFLVFMKEVDGTTINAFTGSDDAVIVYEGPLGISAGVMDVVFTTPYQYNGGNLLIGFYNVNRGSWTNSKWYGESVEGASVQGMDGNSLDAIAPTQRNFIPKTLFLYYPEGSVPTYAIDASANPSDEGTVSGAGTYSLGATCTLTANASGNNIFTSWTEDGVIVSTEPTYTFTVTRNRNLVANFSTNHWTPIVGNQYNMTVTGVISINGVEQTSALLEVGAFCGEECRASEFAQYFPVTQQYVVTLTVRSRTLNGETITFRLYDHLQGRELDELQCVNTVTFENDANIGSIGNWFQFAFNSQVEISATVNPDVAGAVTGTGAYTLGTSATLVAEANEGFAFRDWSLDGEVVSTESTYTFVVTGATHLEANFDYVNAQDLVAGWNWWGTRVEVSGATGLEMIENSLGSNGISIKSQGQSTQNYYPETGYNYWFGSLQTLDIAQGYKINVSEAAQAVMIGAMADPSLHPVTITTEWSWVGYPVGVAQNLSAALSGFTPSANDVFKGQGKTSVYYEDYGWFPDFTLQPGNSYMYKSNDAENKTLVYSIGRSTAVSGEPEHHWQPIGGNQYNMSVTGVIVIDGVEQQSTALEVGAFCGDECRASEFAQYFPVTQQYVVTMTIRSNSASGETITFRLYDHNTGMEPYGVSPNSITFVTDAIVGSMNNWYQFAFVSSQTISTDLAQGWTWFAPTVQTSIEAIQTALGGAYVQILAKNGTPSGDIIPGEMYRIQTNAPCTLAVTGAPITTATITINRGENWFGYVGTEKTVTAAFEGFTPAEGDKVVSQNDGFAIYENGAWVGTLGTLQPGKGYVYVSKDAGTKTLTL